MHLTLTAAKLRAPRSSRRTDCSPWTGEQVFDTVGSWLAERQRFETRRSPNGCVQSRSAREQVLPVIEPLTSLLPHGLIRGTTVVVDGTNGATSFALALAAGASQEGSWIAAVGIPWLGLAAAAERGIALDRLAVIGAPERNDWATVVAALVDAIDIVLVVPPKGRMADARRLAARARERGAVVVALRTPGALTVDLRCTVTDAQWNGVGHGAGHLTARRVLVSASGRGSAARLRTASLWLPGPDGTVSVCDEMDGCAEVTPFIPAHVVHAQAG